MEKNEIKDIEKEKPIMIPSVDARDLPSEILDWCIDKDISTHYQNDIIQIWKDEEDDNIFVEWFESKYDYKFDRTKVTGVAIFAT